MFLEEQITSSFVYLKREKRRLERKISEIDITIKESYRNERNMSPKNPIRQNKIGDNVIFFRFKQAP